MQASIILGVEPPSLAKSVGLESQDVMEQSPSASSAPSLEQIASIENPGSSLMPETSLSWNTSLGSKVYYRTISSDKPLIWRFPLARRQSTEQQQSVMRIS